MSFSFDISVVEKCTQTLICLKFDLFSRGPAVLLCSTMWLPSRRTAAYRNFASCRYVCAGSISAKAQLAGRLLIQQPAAPRAAWQGLGQVWRGGDGPTRPSLSSRAADADAVSSSPCPSEDTLLLLIRVTHTLMIKRCSSRRHRPGAGARSRDAVNLTESRPVSMCCAHFSLVPFADDREDAEPTDEQQRQESGQGMQLHGEAAGRLGVHLHDPGWFMTDVAAFLCSDASQDRRAAEAAFVRELPVRTCHHHDRMLCVRCVENLKD
ncbi:uncharacterized protein LOC106945583 [Poecilia latipinna]|uniref:uncharacterized protein LOC106945583 n=1 Tax=Poecilia latipinna TaxID=48699 RepID=UPI00072E3353|nr:PREDICTED: uncharacterized protein LOC106945583 [Poecilia latipinna]